MWAFILMSFLYSTTAFYDIFKSLMSSRLHFSNILGKLASDFKMYLWWGEMTDGERQNDHKKRKAGWQSIELWVFSSLMQRKNLQRLQRLQVPSHSISSWSKQHEIVSLYICTCDSCHLPLRSGWSIICWDCVSHYETLHAATFSLQGPHFSY